MAKPPDGLREGLPTLPVHMYHLPLDRRGFPVPWFVVWLKDGKQVPVGEGEPDFRVMDADKLYECIRVPRCWICGSLMGSHRVFSIGPMCAINRVISEPPSHRVCAEFAAKACPFLTRPRMRRQDLSDLPKDGLGTPAGFHIERNPGVVCLWETKDYQPFNPNAGGSGILFRLGDPRRVDWYCEGRLATHDEVLLSILEGYPTLQDMAKKEGWKAERELEAAKVRVMKYIPGMM